MEIGPAKPTLHANSMVASPSTSISIFASRTLGWICPKEGSDVPAKFSVVQPTNSVACQAPVTRGVRSAAGLLKSKIWKFPPPLMNSCSGRNATIPPKAIVGSTDPCADAARLTTIHRAILLFGGAPASAASAPKSAGKARTPAPTPARSSRVFLSI